MTKATKLAGIFLMAAAVVLSGCEKIPDGTQAKGPSADAVETQNVAQTAGAATILATTKIGTNYLYELAPLKSKNVTCFMSASIYTGTAVSGATDCVPMPAAPLEPATKSATLETATQVGGTNNFYEVTPATRKDITCFMTSSIYSSTAVSGAIRCLPKAGM